MSNAADSSDAVGAVNSVEVVSAPQRRRILIVEDDARLARLLQEYLSTHGYDADVESRGDRAVDRIWREDPALVVLDLMLPGITGPEVLDAMSHGPATAQLPVIVVTGATLSQRELGSLNVVTMLRKPVDPDDLVDAVYLALHGRRE